MKASGAIALVPGGCFIGCGIWLRRRAQFFLDGASFMSSGYFSWLKHKTNATILLCVGIALLIIGVILLLTGFMKSNAVKNPEVPNTNNTITKPSSTDTQYRLAKLDLLKKNGVII